MVVIDDGYDDSLVSTVLVLQQLIYDTVYVTVRIGTTGLQRHRVWSVAISVAITVDVALFIGISRSRRGCRCRAPVRFTSRVQSFGSRLTIILR